VYKTDPGYVLPEQTADMARLAEQIGGDFDFARVDLYCARGRVWFGEITHYDGNACTAFEPRSYDRIIGDMWQHPSEASTRRRFDVGLGGGTLSRLYRRLLS
jgi:hypothetical protein